MRAVRNVTFREGTLRAKITKIAAAAILAVGSAAGIVATASASEETDTPVPALSTSGQPEESASTLPEPPRSTLAPEPSGTTVPPGPGSTTAPPPEPGRTTAPPPEQAKETPPEPGRTSGPPAEPPPSGYHGNATYYQPGLTACGITITDSDFAVALDSSMFGSGYPSPSCGKKVEITHNGKSITATVVDQSPGAGRYGLDLTPGAYGALASLDQGSIDVTWRFVE
ncbi:RlpA-like double-psi beta-barrel domain-containing protein [Streptomyces sp. NPDC006510]|uniref:RlpA-like double-psi beta-barrel domain-containing protein n=1 Tax=Streptomyces sp. NPDC006510 TaxID=3155600 RepID=UPI0033A6A764